MSYEGKTFSLNKAIEEEQIKSRHREGSPTDNEATTFSRGKTIAENRNRRSRHPEESLAATFLNIHRPRITDYIDRQVKKATKYRKTYQIESPFKPKLSKRSQALQNLRLPHRRNNEDLRDYDSINENYMPLFRSLSLLLDNIFIDDSREPGIIRNKFKRNPTRESNEVVCSCSPKASEQYPSTESYEETVVPTTIIGKEIEIEAFTPSPTTTTKTHSLTTNNISSVGRNTNVSVLPTGNTISFRRNIHGDSERSSTTHIKYTERPITGDNGNHEFDSGDGVHEPYTQNDENHPNSNPRNDSSSHESRGGKGNGIEPFSGNEIFKSSIESTESFQTDLSQYKGTDKYQNRGNKAESTSIPTEFSTELQGSDSKHTNEAIPGHEKDRIEAYYTNAKQVHNRNSTNISENKKNRESNETMKKNKDLQNGKVVIIYDGYSIARDVNGENKLSEQAIQIHT
ncbi:uncharacterized protein LOC126967327 [Leptidea sinapis]|uniref:uncharacterized protein LOC126967327 n=1 Tax=Leptidea sinapis TaxID=189913 RepID=UPI0021C34669|nr:uncharacterized protein LOC126967327 [Leptidea sinapis]